ncbi:MAG TPA: helix-turn-helix transcriptional regulator [Pseudolabrys sp.]|nr:helix-turn-helix transcriptional regulator [Pseudolabrys sp.]
MEITASIPRLPRAARLAAARELIEANLDREDLTPARAAEALKISLRQLHLLFAATGKSFSRTVLEQRLERARRQLIEQPERRVIDIALACGIRSSTVFYRGFRDVFGMNPTEYRQMTLGGRIESAGFPALRD